MAQLKPHDRHCPGRHRLNRIQKAQSPWHLSCSHQMPHGPADWPRRRMARPHLRDGRCSEHRWLRRTPGPPIDTAPFQQPPDASQAFWLAAPDHGPVKPIRQSAFGHHALHRTEVPLSPMHLSCNHLIHGTLCTRCASRGPRQSHVLPPRRCRVATIWQQPNRWLVASLSLPLPLLSWTSTIVRGTAGSVAPNVHNHRGAFPAATTRRVSC